MKRNVFLLIATLLATGLLCGGVGSQDVGLPDRFPQEQSRNNWCATSPETNARLEELNDWVAARERAFLAKYGVRLVKEPGVRLQNGIFLVEADSTTAPFDHPFDLQNSSLVFARKDSQTYIVSKSALVYDPDPGPLFHTFQHSSEPDWYYKAYHLTKFNFPFYDLTANKLYLSAERGIYFSPPTRASFLQYGPLEVIGEQVPVIAPLLHPGGLISRYLFLKESGDALTLTWRSKMDPNVKLTFDLDIQVTLYKNGNILFSYRLVKNVPWGAVIVTSGKESWRTSKTELLSARDFLGDVDPRVEPEWRDPLDIDSVTVERIGQSDLLEFRLKLKTGVTPAAVPADRYLSFTIRLSDGENLNLISFLLYKDRYVYSIPGWGSRTNSPAVTFEGQTLVFRMLESLLTLKSSTVTVEVSTFSPSTWADSLRTAFELDGATMPLEFDFSSIGPQVETTRPIFEVFTLPTLNPYKVWERLKAAYGLTDDEIDAVAIYQNFFTDLILYAGGYSTVGNPGVDGVATWYGYGSKFPRQPALLHLDKIGYGWNSTDRGAIHLLNHEFGHRWLYFFQIMEGGVKSNILNPDRAHPAQYVHTAAAYPVFTPTDSSAMGGSWFTDHGNGTFSTPIEPGYYSYSWHELYLMGLASSREVEDWFYVANSNPPLGGAYYAPVNWRGSGTRKNVNIQQIIDAMGPRVPSYETSQKSFTVLFVVMERPTARATDAEVDAVTLYRLGFEKYFSMATGYRGQVITTTVTVPPPACTATVASDRWRGEYYTNTSLSGTPAMVRDDGAGFIEFNWGAGSPSILCIRRRDEFSVRWTRTVSLEGGVYRFTIVSDDGFRLYVDGSLKLEKWFDQRATTYMVDVPISAGNHTIKLEYYDNVGDALIKLSWRKVR